MSQRILHIIDSLGHTGIAHQLVLLANGLTAKGFDVHVAALDAGGPLAARFASARIPANAVSRRTTLDPIAMIRLARYVAKLRPDVIHSWTADAALYGYAALKVGGGGREGTAAQPWSSEPPAKTRFIMGQYRIERHVSAWRRRVERRIAQHADRLVTNSASVREWCLANGLPAAKFIVVPSGVPSERPNHVPRETLLDELQLPRDAKLIGIIGRLVPAKRVRDLIWAADLLRVLHDNLRVLIIGDGPLRDELERYARLASDLDHIRFLGERDEVGRIIPHLDVLWNGSENVSQSIAILEAMNAGVPVIASDVPVNRELVIDGETGYLIPLGSRTGRAARARQTAHIFDNPQIAEYLAKNAKSAVRDNFPSSELCERYSELYGNICARVREVARKGTGVSQ